MSAKVKTEDLLAGLSAGEQLLWSGRPPQGIMLRTSDLALIPFSLLWGGFACFWTVAATAGGGFFGLFGIPFMLVGLYMTVGRFWADSIQRSHTVYALTSERVMIVSGLFSQQIKSMDLRTLTDITLDSKHSGRGTISFGPSHPMASWYRGMPWPGTERYYSLAFEMIDDARLIYDQICQAQKNAFRKLASPATHF